MFDRSENVPIRVVDPDKKKFVIHTSKETQIQDDGTHLNEMSGNIIGSSVTKMISKLLSDVVESNDQDIENSWKDPNNKIFEKNMNDRMDMLYSGPLKDNFSSKLLKLKKKPTNRHLTDVLRHLSTIDIPFNTSTQVI